MQFGQAVPAEQLSPLGFGDVEIKGVPRVAVRDDGMPSNQQERQAPLAGALSKAGQVHSIIESGSPKAGDKLRGIPHWSKANRGKGVRLPLP